MFLRSSPICADPFGVHAERREIVEAKHVDHIIPRNQGGSDAWDNLQGLCHSCHSKKTARGVARWPEQQSIQRH